MLLHTKSQLYDAHYLQLRVLRRHQEALERMEPRCLDLCTRVPPLPCAAGRRFHPHDVAIMAMG